MIEWMIAIAAAAVICVMYWFVLKDLREGDSDD